MPNGAICELGNCECIRCEAVSNSGGRTRDLEIVRCSCRYNRRILYSCLSVSATNIHFLCLLAFPSCSPTATLATFKPESSDISLNLPQPNIFSSSRLADAVHHHTLHSSGRSSIAQSREDRRRARHNTRRASSIVLQVCSSPTSNGFHLTYQPPDRPDQWLYRYPSMLSPPIQDFPARLSFLRKASHEIHM